MYLTIWDKILSRDEEVEYEFSIGLRYRLLGLVVWILIALIILLLGLSTPEEYGDTPFLASLILAAVLIIFAIFYHLFYLKIANVYAFTNRRVLIYRGWLSTSLVSINYENITDVTVRERFFEKLIAGTGDVVIDTAGTSDFEVSLASIASPYEVAKKLNNIRNKIKKYEPNY